MIVHQHGVVKKMAILRKRKDNKACGDWGGHWEMAGTSQTPGHKDSEAAAPLRCGAHEVPGTSVNAGVISIASLSESSSSNC